MGKRDNETPKEREERLAYNRLWHQEHREEENRKRMDRYHNYQNDVQISEYKIKRLEVLERMGGKCVFCGQLDETALTIDHVKNDGAKERKVSTNIYYQLYKLEVIPMDRYQVLCWTCNHKKRLSGPDPSQWPPNKTVPEALAYLRANLKTMEQARKEANVEAEKTE